MTTATTILATAHTLGQIRKAALERCVGTFTDHAKGREEFRFDDRSTIVLTGKKISVGRWVYIEEPAADPKWRQCRAPDCWECKGTGIDRAGNPCVTNDAPPF